MYNQVDFSVITVSYNSSKTIKQTIDSVLCQINTTLEYIVIDGNSSDDTVKILNSIKDQRFSFVSEKDNGLYDAMNKGISKARGKYIAIINSDDVYVDNLVLYKVMCEFEFSKSDIVSGNIYYFNDDIFKKKRIYSSPKLKRKLSWAFGAQPPHPSTFIKKRVYDEIGFYNTDFKISSDYEFLFRAMYVNDFKYKKMDRELVAMRLGGESTNSLKSIYMGNKEVVKSWNINGKSAPISLIPTKLLRKYINK